MLCVANLAVYTRWDSFKSDNFYDELEPSFHWQQICQPAVDTLLACPVNYFAGLRGVLICRPSDNQLANLRATTHSLLHHTKHTLTLQ